MGGARSGRLAGAAPEAGPGAATLLHAAEMGVAAAWGVAAAAGVAVEAVVSLV